MILYQPKSGYCYNSDSILLYNFISRFSPKGRLLDVGAGCGIVGLLVARDYEKVRLFGIEKQDIFLAYVKKNAQINNISYTLFHVDFLDFNESLVFDFIISNPPFYHDGVCKSKDEMLYSARYNVNLPIKQFFVKVAKILSQKGHFIFCYDAKQFALICTELSEINLRVVDVQFVHSKSDKKASLVMIHARKNSKSLLNVLPPFISFIGDKFTDELIQIYEKSNTKSVKCQL